MTKPSRAISRCNSAETFGGSAEPSGVCSVPRRSAALRRVGLKLRMPSRARVPFIRLTMRVRSPTRHSRSRVGRLASSSAMVGTRAMVQWPRSPRSHPKNPRFSNSVSSRSVLARRCSRDTATLEAWITCASTPRALSQRANQKPSRPASKASAIRVILRPALTASSRQRCSRPSSFSALGSSFLRGWRSMPGSIPATSQLDWLISTTAMIVLSWSRATRDLLKSFGWGIRALHQLATATMVPFPRRLPHTISLLEEARFEPSVPLWLGAFTRSKTSMSGPVGVGGFEEGEFEGDGPLEKVAAQILLRGADAVQLRAQEIDEAAKPRIVVQRDPLGVHEIDRQRLRRAGGPVEIEPFGHDEDRKRGGIAARFCGLAHDRLEAGGR